MEAALAISVSKEVHREFRVQELCESRGGRPGLPVPNKPTVSVDVKQHYPSLFQRAQSIIKQLLYDNALNRL